MSTKLFVGNLDFKVTENDLQDAFAAHGTVVEANLMMDRATGRPRGFAFVTMSSPEEAQKAIEALNGKELGGRALTVNLARPREERSGGGGGGGSARIRGRPSRPLLSRKQTRAETAGGRKHLRFPRSLLFIPDCVARARSEPRFHWPSLFLWLVGEV